MSCCLHGRARCSVVAAQSWAVDPDGASLIQARSGSSRSHVPRSTPLRAELTGLPAPLLSRFDLILGLRGAGPRVRVSRVLVVVWSYLVRVKIYLSSRGARTGDEELAEAILGAGTAAAGP